MRYTFQSTRAEDFWKICGSFGVLTGTVERDSDTVCLSGGVCSVRSEYAQCESGVISRRDSIQNTSSSPITLNCLLSKFRLEGGEYEVYTQLNTWQNECQGAWQPLVSAISAETEGLRSAYGGAPFFALWNRQTGRGAAFHIVTKLPWKYEVKYVPTGGEANVVEIEAGLNSWNLSLELAAGASLELPEILYYEFRSRLDLDCHKLHHHLNLNYPRAELPVLYNTWMYKFEKIDFDNVSAQIPAAKALGVEYFVIDAAWFGQGNFWDCRGDWYENETEAFRGRMSELSERVRQNGMQFGLWLEIETAGPASRMLREHADYYFTHDSRGQTLYFFDFANEAACDYLLKTVVGLIERYHVRFIKFDFNQDLRWDSRRSAYLDYFRGYDRFIQTLRALYPDLHMENCASGGLRMSLASGLSFDSIWISDNHSPYEGMRIFKDALLRMPPQWIDKWAVIESVCDFRHSYDESGHERLFTANDATWGEVRGIEPSYLEGFLTGGPVGFSCDLTSLSDAVFSRLQAFVAQFKKDREFWKSAVCRILADTQSVLVLEYSDVEFDKVVLLVCTNRLRQKSITVYPQLNQTADYILEDGTLRSAAQIDADGIEMPLPGNVQAVQMTLVKATR